MAVSHPDLLLSSSLVRDVLGHVCIPQCSSNSTYLDLDPIPALQSYSPALRSACRARAR